jgi:serine/threonine-protein kinase RsbW
MGMLGELSTTADVGSVEEIVEFVAGHARSLGFSDQKTVQLSSAVTEAMQNIIDHAYHGTPGEVHVSCKEDQGGRFVITISDSAEPLNVLLGDDPWPSQHAGKAPSKGPSTALMKRFAGNIEYRRMDGKNMLTFTIAGTFPSKP